MYHTWIRKEDLIRDWLSRLHSVYSCYRLLCSSVKERPDISWSFSWVSDSCRTTWRCTRRSKTTVTPGRPARQTPRPRVRLATPISGFKPTPFGKFWSLKTRCMKFHCWNMYLDLSVSVWNQTRLKWRYEIMEWIEYEKKNCEFNRMLLLPQVVIRLCGCCRYRPASEGDDASATSPKKTKGDNKSQKTVRRKMDELWNGESYIKTLISSCALCSLINHSSI